jgi:sugar transferase (PEP-CTERM/EpsH1 system associated)
VRRALRILFVSSRFPYPLVQGDRVRAFHQIRLLSRVHRITLLTPFEDKQDLDGLERLRPYCESIEKIAVSPLRRALRLAGAPLSSLPLQTLYFFDSRFARKARELAQTKSFDLIHVQTVRMAPVIDGWQGAPAAVLDLIDSLALNMERRARSDRAPLAWAAALEAKRLRRYERELTRKFDRVIVCSQIDAESIGCFANLHVVPLGVDLDSFRFAGDDSRETRTIVFSGRMGYFPNADAAEFFAKQIFPIVRKRIPDARFLIVGREVPKTLRRNCGAEGISIFANVPAIYPYLAKATVAVAPMRTGSGVQFKILEAMASGAPVVGTSLSVAGLGVTPGQHLLTADDPESFAQQVVSLLHDIGKRRRLAREARDFVERKYTWEESIAELERVYEFARTGGNKATRSAGCPPALSSST